jgi:endonuclease/exonuclease/phosphatase family metal-dependent hydrolase
MRVISMLSLAATLTTATLMQQTTASETSTVPELSNRLSHSPLAPCPDKTTPDARVRVASWNIKAARAAPLDTLAAEMRAMQADVIALQEVDVGTRRSGNSDQPAALAAALGFHYAFAASIRWDDGDYGLALVSKWPLAHVERHRVGVSTVSEPRIVLAVTICTAGGALRILNHHADDQPAARARGFADVQRIVKAAAGRGVLVVGDMNEDGDGPGIRMLRTSGLSDLGARAGVSTSDAGRIDYVFADGPLLPHASAARVWQTDKSDHDAVLTDLRWP